MLWRIGKELETQSKELPSRSDPTCLPCYGVHHPDITPIFTSTIKCAHSFSICRIVRNTTKKQPYDYQRQPVTNYTSRLYTRRSTALRLADASGDGKRRDNDVRPTHTKEMI